MYSLYVYAKTKKNSVVQHTEFRKILNHVTLYKHMYEITHKSLKEIIKLSNLN